MGLDSSRELAENKLVLLYIIDQVNMPISNLQVTKIILENKFMNYFFLQQYLKELCDQTLITASEKENKLFYTMTPKGKQTLSFFTNHIPAVLKAQVDNSIASIRKRIKNETLIIADYEPGKGDEYIVTCKVNEDDFSLININITVGTKHDARTICENWKTHSQEIYIEVIDSLIKKRTVKGTKKKD